MRPISEDVLQIRKYMQRWYNVKSEHANIRFAYAVNEDGNVIEGASRRPRKTPKFHLWHLFEIEWMSDPEKKKLFSDSSHNQHLRMSHYYPSQEFYPNELFVAEYSIEEVRKFVAGEDSGVNDGGDFNLIIESDIKKLSEWLERKLTPRFYINRGPLNLNWR